MISPSSMLEEEPRRSRRSRQGRRSMGFEEEEEPLGTRLFEREEYKTMTGALDKRRVVPRMLQMEKKGYISSEEERKLF